MNIFERANEAIKNLDYLMEPYDDDDDGTGKDLSEVKSVLVDLMSVCSGGICWVKFSCGCIGTVPVPAGAENRSKIIKACDVDCDGMDDGLRFLDVRDMSDSAKPKEFRVLDPEDRVLVETLTKIRDLFNDGYKFRRVKDALR